jgi:hypothetical protein
VITAICIFFLIHDIATFNDKWFAAALYRFRKPVAQRKIE